MDIDGNQEYVKIVARISGKRRDYLLQHELEKKIYYMKKVKLFLHGTIQKGSGWTKYLKIFFNFMATPAAHGISQARD